MCLLGERIIQAIISRHDHVTHLTLRNWFNDYLEHITRNGLYEHKAAVSRRAQVIQMFQGNQ